MPRSSVMGVMLHVWSITEAMAIEIVSFPKKDGGSNHSYVNVYQRVTYGIKVQ